MPATYGYFLGTVGADKDHVDVFVGDTLDAPSFWVINQTQPDSAKFDEHKVVAGVTSADEAKRIYLDSFSDGFGDKVFSSIAGPYPVGELADVLPKLKAKKPFGVEEATKDPREAYADEKEKAYIVQRRLTVFERYLPLLSQFSTELAGKEKQPDYEKVLKRLQAHAREVEQRSVVKAE